MAFQRLPWLGFTVIVLAVTISEGCWVNVATASPSSIPVTVTPSPGGSTEAGNSMSTAGVGSPIVPTMAPPDGSTPVLGGSTPIPDGGNNPDPVLTTTVPGGSPTMPGDITTSRPGLPDSPAPPGVTPQAALPMTTASTA